MMNLTGINKLLDALSLTGETREALTEFYVGEFKRLNGHTVKSLGQTIGQMGNARHRQKKSNRELKERLNELESLLLNGTDLEIMDAQARLRSQREERMSKAKKRLLKVVS